MKLYSIALVVLCSLSLAVPAMATNLTATQISSTEMQVDGTGFNPGAVTLLTETSISVTPSGDDYSYELTGIYLPANWSLALDASPVNDDLKLYLKKNWLIAYTFDKSDGSTIGYLYDSSTGNVHVERRVPSPIAGRFQTMRVSGTTAHSSVDLNVMVQWNVTADGSGSFSELVDISAIPAGDYKISANDGANSVTAQTAISAPGDLHRIAITDPETDNLTLDTNGNYIFGATGYDYLGAVVQGTAFTWTSSSTDVGTIDSTGYFEADTVGNTTVYARGGTKESNPVTVHVNAPTVITTTPHIHIDGKNCVNMPFVARLTDTLGSPIAGGTIIYSLGGAQFVRTTDASGYSTFTPTTIGTLLAIYSNESVTCEIIDDPTLCTGGCNFGTDPQAGDLAITSFTTDKTTYARGETMTITIAVLNSAGEMYKKLLIDTSSTKSDTGLPLGFVGSWSFVDTGSSTYEMRLYIPTSTDPGTYNVAGGMYTDYLADGGSILDIASQVSVTIT